MSATIGEHNSENVAFVRPHDMRTSNVSTICQLSVQNDVKWKQRIGTISLSVAIDIFFLYLFILHSINAVTIRIFRI